MCVFTADTEGCVCPEGLLRLGEKCVEEEECGCIMPDTAQRIPVSGGKEERGREGSGRRGGGGGSRGRGGGRNGEKCLEEE